jgi:predicted DNA-binding transcriptional regulator YafY
MSFAKAEQLLDLAVFISANQQGVTLDHVIERYGVHLRTAQRMMRSIESRFPDIEAVTDSDNRKRWRPGKAEPLSLVAVSAEELAALSFAIQHMEHLKLDIELRHLSTLRDKVLATLPRTRLARIAPDFEALLEAQGFVARPGPKSRIAPEIAFTVAEAIKGCQPIEIVYRSHLDDDALPRTVWPLGLLTGIRRYLVALDPHSRRQGTIKTYRMDAISSATVTDGFFERPKGFDLHAFAQQSFGLFQRDGEIDDIEWRFDAKAARHAAAIEFHPSQSEEWHPDGALTVRFRAAGFLEMAWYLYQWGDAVEVLKPTTLRELVRDHRRRDFPAFP